MTDRLLSRRWLWAACACQLALLALLARIHPAPADEEAARDLRGHGGPVKAVAISADGTRALTGSFDYTVMHWRLGEGRPQVIGRFIGHDAAVNAVTFVPGGKLAVTGSDDGTVGLWRLQNGRLLARFEGHEGKVVAVAVSADGRFAASAGWDGTARLWDLDARRPLAVLEGHAGKVNAVAMTGDGRHVLTGGADGTVRLWRAPDGRLVRTAYDHGWGVTALVLLPGSEQILLGGLNGDVKLVDIASGEALRTLATHERPVLSLTVSPRHRLAASGSADGKIRVWSLDGWRLLRSHDNPYGPVWTLAVAGDGKGLYHAGLDEFVIHWQMQPRQPFETVRSRPPRFGRAAGVTDPGERYFLRKCSVCHTLGPDDANKAGPSLYRLFGRRVGTLPGYVYSQALKQADFVWNEKTVGELFGRGPQELVPGTKMPLQRMTNEDERKALIAYLKRATAGKGGEK